MPVVAIAGGTSPSLGRSIVLGILSRYPSDAWKPLILSRSTKRPLWLQAIDPDSDQVEVRAVDYNSESSLTLALKGAHTVLSVILTKDATQAETMIRLLHASVAADVKRSVPSYWGAGVDSWKKIWLLDMATKGIWDECLVCEERTSGRLQVARFNCGMHMNYLGIGARPDNERYDDQARLQQLKDGAGYAAGDDLICQGVDKEGDMADESGSFLVSPLSATAELPTTHQGQSPHVTMTAIRDIGRFVAASLDHPRWQHDMNIVGQTIALTDLVSLAEAATGKKFQVTKLSPSQIEEQLSSLAPEQCMQGLWLGLKLMCARNRVNEGYLEPTVNELCSDVEPMGIEEFLKLAWS